MIPSFKDLISIVGLHIVLLSGVKTQCVEIVLDTNKEPSSEKPIFSLTAIGTDLYFVAYDIMYGYELWKSDGTISGTVMVPQIKEYSCRL